MPILTLLVVIIVVGVLLWLVNTYIPMAAPWKQILNAVAVILIVIWVLEQTGLLHGLKQARI